MKARPHGWCNCCQKMGGAGRFPPLRRTGGAHLAAKGLCSTTQPGGHARHRAAQTCAYSGSLCYVGHYVLDVQYSPSLDQCRTFPSVLGLRKKMKQRRYRKYDLERCSVRMQGWLYASVGKLICNPIKNLTCLQEDIKRLIFTYYKIILCAHYSYVFVFAEIWEDDRNGGEKNSCNYLERRLMLTAHLKKFLSKAAFLCSLLQLAWNHHGDTIILH